MKGLLQRAKLQIRGKRVREQKKFTFDHMIIPPLLVLKGITTGVLNMVSDPAHKGINVVQEVKKGYIVS